jgi:hypothetical protein
MTTTSITDRKRGGGESPRSIILKAPQCGTSFQTKKSGRPFIQTNMSLQPIRADMSLRPDPRMPAVTMRDILPYQGKTHACTLPTTTILPIKGKLWREPLVGHCNRTQGILSIRIIRQSPRVIHHTHPSPQISREDDRYPLVPPVTWESRIMVHSVSATLTRLTARDSPLVGDRSAYHRDPCIRPVGVRPLWLALLYQTLHRLIS